MREILFRGKRTDNGTWAYGYLFCIWERTYLCWGTTNDVPNMKEVLPETVGQFTGLTDKNGVKIFEGDIVRYCDTIHQVVFEQRNTTAYFGLVYSEIETIPFGHYQDLKQIEVIGNIHDNPELLKGGGEE